MDEKEVVDRFHEAFDLTLTTLGRATRAFLFEKESVLRQNVEDFRDMMRTGVSHAEKVIVKTEKDEVEKRYVNLVLPYQAVLLGIESLLFRMLAKVRARLLFSEKAFNELRNLFNIMEGQLRDTKDYIASKNPHLKQAVRHGMEQMMALADDYSSVHQDRLIGGICVPEASYLYVDMTDSFKRVSRALVDFTERF